MRGLRIMSWFYIIFFLSFTITCLEAASGKKQLQSAVVVGTVYCDTCFQESFSKPTHFISGATVAVECKDETSKTSFRQEAKTDKHGEFKVHLPFSVSKHVKKIKRCSVKLISSSEPYCAVAATATSSSLRLKSRQEGAHIFSAGFFSFKPLKQPSLCNQKPSLENSEQFNSEKSSLIPVPDTPALPPPLQDPTTPDLPPVGQNPLPLLPPLPRLPPLPALPPLPPLPGLPYLPPLPGKNKQAKSEELSKASQISEQKVAKPQTFLPPLQLPPNPFLPPPTSPPNPLQPPLLFPPLFPPNPLLPPPPPSFSFPPGIPGFTPPPPPSFPFPLPPFPPSTPFPGIPPASSSPKKHSP